MLNHARCNYTRSSKLWTCYELLAASIFVVRRVDGYAFDQTSSAYVVVVFAVVETVNVDFSVVAARGYEFPALVYGNLIDRDGVGSKTFRLDGVSLVVQNVNHSPVRAKAQKLEWKSVSNRE